MKPVAAKNILRRVAAALTLTVSFIAVERANAACTPATSETVPVSNTTVTCSGATVDQNPTTFAGYGTGNENGVTIDVQAGASVTSTSVQPAASGIVIGTGTVNNLGTVGVTGVLGTGIFGLNGITVNNSGFINFDGAAGHGDRGIWATSGNANVTNTGTVFGNSFGIEVDSGTANVTNSGTVRAGVSDDRAVAIFGANDVTVVNSGSGSLISSSRVGIQAVNGNANVTNEGVVEATGTRGTAIAGATVIVDNSGSIRVTAADAVGAIESVGDGTVRNSGTISSAGNNSFGIKSGTGALSVDNLSGGTITVVGTNSVAINAATDATVTNAGNIQGAFLGGAGAAIKAGGTATVSNDQRTTSLISAGAFGINAQTVIVTGNIGVIEATAGNGVAINAGGDANVTNGTGTIQASVTNGIAIAAGGTAAVTNAGTITADKSAIAADTINVNANSGTISTTGANGSTIRATNDATVANSGTIKATGDGSTAVNAGGTASISNSGFIQTTGGPANVTIFATTVDIISNTGTIEAFNGSAISAGANATVNNSNGTISATSGPGLPANAIRAGGIATVTNGTGTIQATGANSNAITAGGAAKVTNGTGIITGNAFAILAPTVNVTNAGTIEATNANATAIFASADATVTDNSGTIQAKLAGGRGIFAGGTATVANSGTITGAASGIVGSTVNVTANSGTISGNTGIFTLGSATVSNLSGGSITGNATGIQAGTLDVTNAFGGTISGGVSGIVADNSGTVRNAGTITGMNSSVAFNGSGTNTLILQTGSLLNGDALGSGTSTNNKLILQGTGTANNNFVSFNSLDMQTGGGTWTLNGDSQVGIATISNGVLEIGDTNHTSAKLGGDVTVNSGGMLAGQGTVIGNLNATASGFIRPGAMNGTTPGTLTVSGNATFEGGSVFVVGANAAGQASKLAVEGTATLNNDARVQVTAQNGTYAPSTQYTILTAAGGLGSTTFSSVTSNLAFLTPTLSYDANGVFLTLALGTGTGGTGAGFANVAQTPNQRAVAGALETSPSTNPLVTALLNQTADGARQAFDALSGEVYGSVHNSQAEEAQFARSAMLGRMRQASYAGTPGELGALGFAGPQLAYASASAAAAQASAYPVKAAPYAPSRDLTFWTQGFGGWGQSDGDGNAASLRSRFGGFLSGVDARFGEAWRAGFAAGYLRSDIKVDARASSAGIDSVQLGLYATGRLGAFNVRTGASYSLDDIDASRGISFAGFTDQTKARFHGNVGQVFGEVGYGMTFNHLAVEPLAGLAYVHLRNGSFLESGGAAALSGASSHENIGYSSLGLRLASIMPLANGTVLVPRATVAWQYAFGDVTPTAGLAFQGTGTAFSVAGVPIARNSALVEGGFDWRFSPWAKLGLAYQGELAAHAQTHALKGAFTWDF